MSTDQQKIRNFSIIAHIDHGKSTLADRLLELTHTVEQRKMKDQYLDMMDLEREKGITIKLQPVRMEYQGYVLNLIDTPGHVDFSYEVSRSLAAVEGAILIIDASQGVQAQTMANLTLAQNQGLKIIPVINKIDLPHAKVDEVRSEIKQLLHIEEADIINISAKNNLNIEAVLEAIVGRIPAPKGKAADPLQALIFDSDYDLYKGVIAYVRIVNGEIKNHNKIRLIASRAVSEVIELGVFKPNPIKKDSLSAGEIGYVATGLKSLDQCRVGDTITLESFSSAQPLVGYRESKSLVFASLYPASAEDFDDLKDSLDKLKLSDASLIYEPESCEGLGRGFRCGFLGMLHLEIIIERLKREYDLSLVITSPSVEYHVNLRNKKQIKVASAQDMPPIAEIDSILEPWVNLELILPSQYMGQVMKLMDTTRSKYADTKYLGPQRVLVKYEAPLNEIIVNFYDKLKNISSGYASMSYELGEYHVSDLVKLDVLIAGEKAEAFSKIVHRSKVDYEARDLVKRLKQAIPKQLFAVAIQASVNGNIIARETLSAMRKDVTGYLYGGDYTRKRKLLEKQKKGKKKMKAIGKVNIPQEVFFKVLKK